MAISGDLLLSTMKERLMAGSRTGLRGSASQLTRRRLALLSIHFAFFAQLLCNEIEPWRAPMYKSPISGVRSASTSGFAFNPLHSLQPTLPCCLNSLMSVQKEANDSFYSTVHMISKPYLQREWSVGRGIAIQTDVIWSPTRSGRAAYAG